MITDQNHLSDSTVIPLYSEPQYNEEHYITDF